MLGTQKPATKRVMDTTASATSNISKKWHKGGQHKDVQSNWSHTHIKEGELPNFYTSVASAHNATLLANIVVVDVSVVFALSPLWTSFSYPCSCPAKSSTFCLWFIFFAWPFWVHIINISLNLSVPICWMRPCSHNFIKESLHLPRIKQDSISSHANGSCAQVSLNPHTIKMQWSLLRMHLKLLKVSAEEWEAVIVKKRGQFCANNSATLNNGRCAGRPQEGTETHDKDRGGKTEQASQGRG